jgi:hypothetical protein
MPVYATPLAVCLYLLPTALVLVARSSRRRPAWEMGLDIAMVAAIDLLVIDLLSRTVTVETAVLLSRPLWILAAGGATVWRSRRGRELRWPEALGLRELGALAFTCLLALLVSLQLSRPKSIWDRQWHMPLSASLRGQSLPFQNVYEPGPVLHYHITGNVLAAELQVLSGDVLHAAYALSLAHDIFFVLTAAAIGLAILHFSGRRLVALPLAVAVLLAGPFTLRGPDGSNPMQGYSFLNLLTLSFRPHVPLSELLMAGFVIALLARIADGGPAPVAKTLPGLFACVSVLGLTDESSTATMCASLGVAWLVFSKIVADTRLAGVGVFVGLAAAIIGPNVLFSAALAPGGPLQKLSFVPWRNPGFENPVLLLSGRGGLNVLFCDTLPFVLPMVGLAIAMVFAPSRQLGALAVFVWTLCCMSTLAMTRLEINTTPHNVQRFMVAPIYVAPLAGILAIEKRWWSSLGRGLLLVGLGAGCFCTVFWLRYESLGPGTHTAAPEEFSPKGFDFYDLDCRKVAGAHRGERASRAYVDRTLQYLFTGCRPVYVPGGDQAYEIWHQKTFSEPTARGFAEFDAEVGDGPLRVVCPAKGPSDEVCQRVERSRCPPAGSAFVECMTTAAERLAILGRR